MAAWSYRTGLAPMTTRKSTTATSTVVRTPPFEGRRVKQVRVGVQLRQSSGDIEVRVFQRVSDDGVSFGAAATVSGYTTYVSTDGYTFGTTFATTTATPFIEFGVEARNKTGTKVDCVLAELILDFVY